MPPKKPPTVYKTGNKPKENIYSKPTAQMTGKLTDKDLKQMYVQASKTAQAAEKEIKKRGINKPRMPTPKSSPQSSPKPELKARKNPTIAPRPKKKNLAFKEEK